MAQKKNLPKKAEKPVIKTEKPVWATIFTIIGILILCGLGMWQIQRLEEKTVLIAKIDTAANTDPMKNRLTVSSFINADKINEPFISGYVVGRYLHRHEIIIGPRTYEGLPGYHVITPVVLENGGTLLVNRGWVTEEKADPDNRSASLTPGMTVVAGIARKPEKKGRFTPENNLAKDEWYWPDMEAIAKEHNLINVMPYILYAQASQFQPYKFPRPLNMSWKPPNNHKGYAIFWFTMAALLALFYYLRFIKVKS